MTNIIQCAWGGHPSPMLSTLSSSNWSLLSWMSGLFKRFWWLGTDDTATPQDKILVVLLLVTAAIFPAVFPPLVDPATVKRWFPKTNIYSVMQATHPLRQCILRLCVWRMFLQPAHIHYALWCWFRTDNGNEHAKILLQPWQSRCWQNSPTV